MKFDPIGLVVQRLETGGQHLATLLRFILELIEAPNHQHEYRHGRD